MKQRYLLLFFSLILLFFVGYWIKCQVCLNFSQEVSLSSYAPFKYLQRDNVIHLPPPGTLLNDSFETRRLISNWSHLWMREVGKVSLNYSSLGRDNSRCLLIASKSSQSWSCSHNKFVEVEEGDIFSLEGYIKLQRDKMSGYVGVAAFNRQKQAIKWNYISEKVNESNKWIKVIKSFIIPSGINYIKFRLTGVGIGEFYFDDIRFKKEERIVDQ